LRAKVCKEIEYLPDLSEHLTSDSTGVFCGSQEWSPADLWGLSRAGHTVTGQRGKWWDYTVVPS